MAFFDNLSEMITGKGKEAADKRGCRAAQT